MAFFKKVKEKIGAFQKKQALNIQISAEKKARQLEEQAKYNEQLNKRLERQIKAQKVLEKTERLKQKLQPKPQQTYNPYSPFGYMGMTTYQPKTTKSKQKPYNPFNLY